MIYKDNYGNYRSPLLLNNGDTIKNVNDWNKKRKKIKDTWMNLMGKWPPIIKNQKFEILDTLKRENFYQYRVRFYWVPNEQTEGYLLIPDKRGKKPAIISVFMNLKLPLESVENLIVTSLINLLKEDLSPCH